ncbi:LysR substrate binding domain protein [compost metagenome]
MVSSGLGVAVIPLSTRDLQALDGVVKIPFADSQRMRRVVLLEREDRPAGRLASALSEAVRRQVNDG